MCHYNQNRDKYLSTVFWKDFELKNNKGNFGSDILVLVVGDNLGVTGGNILGRSYEVLLELKLDAYLVLGDTNSCFSAVSAKRLHISLFHMEAGNRCKGVSCYRIYRPEKIHRRTGSDGSGQTGNVSVQESIVSVLRKKMNCIKGLLGEGDGFLMLYNRLDNGRFQWPRNELEACQLTPQQTRWLLECLPVEQPKAIKEGVPEPLY